MFTDPYTTPVTIDGADYTPPTWDQIERMDLTEVRRWLALAAEAMETLWDPEANGYRHGVGAWSLVEDACLTMIMRLA